MTRRRIPISGWPVTFTAEEMAAIKAGIDQQQATLDAVIRERDEARAEVERLRDEVKRGHVAHKAACEGGDLLREEIERLRAEGLRLTRERDETLAERNVAIAVVVASYAAMWACTALWSMP